MSCAETAEPIDLPFGCGLGWAEESTVQPYSYRVCLLAVSVTESVQDDNIFLAAKTFRVTYMRVARIIYGALLAARMLITG